jgi:hypothetical protein
LFSAPQSGHSQVIPLHVMPQAFSSMHSWHIVKPHLHLQLKAASFRQQWQVRLWALRRLA